MEFERNERQEALQRLAQQEQGNSNLLAQSQARFLDKQRAYYEAKAELENAHRARADLRKVVDRNFERIAERRGKLESDDFDTIDEDAQRRLLRNLGEPTLFAC